MVIVLLAASVAGGCGSQNTTSQPKRDVVIGDSQEIFPSDSLRDWKSYADHVAVYKVVDEAALPVSSEDQERGEGMVGREITITVNRLLWSAAGAPELPSSLRIRAPGWVLHDGQRTPLMIRGGRRPEVGQQFLGPLVEIDDAGSSTWGFLTSGSSVPLEDGRAAPPAPEEYSPLRGQLAGKSEAEIRQLVERQQPDPEAAKRGNLRPQERVVEVYRARQDKR
jgi:hypothetical protein